MAGVGRGRSSAAIIDDDDDDTTVSIVPSTKTKQSPASVAVKKPTTGRGNGNAGNGSRPTSAAAKKGSNIVAGLSFEAGADPFGSAARTITVSTTNGSSSSSAPPTAIVSASTSMRSGPVVVASSSAGVVYAANPTDDAPRVGTAAEKKIRLAAGVRSTSPWRAFAVHCKKSAYDVYVGRRNPTIDETDFRWGNPFKGATSSLDEYREWIEAPAQAEYCRRVRAELRGRILACWCSPLPCHSDTLAEVANTTNWPIRLWREGDPLPVVPTPAEAKAQRAADEAKAALDTTATSPAKTVGRVLGAPKRGTSASLSISSTATTNIPSSSSTAAASSAAAAADDSNTSSLSAAAKRRARKKKTTGE